MTEAAPSHPGAARKVAVWDPLVRVVHWSVAALFLANSALLEEGGAAHRYAGYAILALVAMRLAWGLVGTAHARFSAFPPSVGAALAHAGDLVAGRPRRHLSHNPLGALMAYALWAALVAICLTGIATHLELLPGEAAEEIHETLANLGLAAVGLHVAGVLIESRLSRTSLVRAMVTGRKTDPSA